MIDANWFKSSIILSISTGNIVNRFLSLEQGQLSGSFPGFLGSLSQLLIIDLDFNALTGTIPQEIYGLSQLRQVRLKFIMILCWPSL
jgi:hypothetical protein